MSLKNRRKDFSQKPPKTPIIPGVLSVIDSPSINLTFNNSTQELQADLQSIISPGTYGSSTLIPVFTINSFGQIVSITQVPASGSGGSAAWGAIAPGSGVGSQADLVAYLNANYYSISNPAGYITSSALIPYLTITGAALTYAPLTRLINTQHSLTGGGDLSANRTLSLVNDTASPGANKVYGTDALGVRGWKNDPSGGGLTSVGLILNPAPSSPAIQINNTPLTSNGNLEIQFLGGTTDYVRGDGSLGVFPNVPSNALIYPYTRRQYFNTGDTRAVGYYQDKIFVANNTGNNVRVFDAVTTQILSTTTINLANTSQIIDDIAIAEHWCTSTGGAFIARHNAVTGAFIASTTPTGVVTNAQQSRFASFNSTKSIGANLTNVYTINPNTFVTANLSAHGLGALMPYLAINKNPSSLQNGLAMIGGQNGIILFNCTTNAIVLAATNLGGVLGNVLEISYDAGNDYWYVASLVGGALRISALQPTSLTTFSVVYTITTASSFDFTLTGGNAKQVSIVPIPALGQLYVCVNRLSFLYSSITGTLIKSNFYFDNPGTVRPTYALLDAPNKRFFFCTGGGTGAFIYELIYDE